MPPHPVLDMPDILSVVFSVLSPDILYTQARGSLVDQEHFVDEAEENQATLARCARVCRAFYEPSVDVLWRGLYDLGPLLKILSSYTKVLYESSDHARVDDDDDEGAFRYILRQSISPYDWSRFQFYACRVRSLYWNEGDHTIDLSVFFHLARQSKWQPLLPKLQELEWWSSSFAHMGMLASLLIPPTLRQLCVDYYLAEYSETPRRRDYALESVMRVACTRAPFLKDIELWQCGHSLSLSPIASCKNLRRLKLQECRLDVHILRAISSMTSLVELVVDDLMSLSDDSKVIIGTGFCNLQRLELVGTLSCVSQVLDAVSSPRLSSLFVDAVRTPSVQDFRVALDDWYPRLTTLHSVGFYASGVDGGPYMPAPARTIIQPLLALHDLTEVKLHLDLTYSDEDLCSIAEAWPRLQILHLRSFSTDVFPSLSGVAGLARLCPLLDELVLPGIREEPTPTVQESYKLRWLQITNRKLHIVDPARVAQVLHDLFPALSPVSRLVVYPVGFVPGEGWRRVLDQLAHLQGQTRVLWDDELD